MQIFYAIFVIFLRFLAKLLGSYKTNYDFARIMSIIPQNAPTSSIHINSAKPFINFSFTIHLYISDLHESNINRRIWI